MFNIILCQQIGCGFFDKADVKIYDFIHSYINIPDTSGRDSLFQAEARRCKEILSIIEISKTKSIYVYLMNYMEQIQKKQLEQQWLS